MHIPPEFVSWLRGKYSRLTSFESAWLRHPTAPITRPINLRSIMMGRMQIEPRPPWLIRQENGAIAEARTRALLMDRFWVLERSADVEGADLIIQRRLTGRSLLDRTPPRLGFIQTKFYSNPSTTHYVHSEYVSDSEGNPRPEFFLICHTGTEDGTEAHLLSAEDVAKHFGVTPESHSKPNRFVLPGKDVLVQKFQVLDRRSSLDRIERALRDADFERNRAFAAWVLPVVKDELPPILPMYEEPIDNRWTDIPKEFNKLREAAQWASYEFATVHGYLCEIQESRDPEQAFAVVQKLERESGKSVKIPDELFDDALLTAVQSHKRRFQQLTEAGLLGAHSAMRRMIIERMVRDVAPRMPLARDDVFELTTEFDASTLTDVRHRSRFVKADAIWPKGSIHGAFGDVIDMPDTCGILIAEAGTVAAYVAPGRYSYQYLVKEGWRGEPGDWGNWGEWADTPGTWTDRLKAVAETFTTMILEQVLKDRFDT
jgi:hypothetical protein